MCKSEKNVEMYKDRKGFPQAVYSESEKEFFDSVCPAGGKASSQYQDGIWGKYQEVYCGWSNNPDVRKKASSGGILTSICIYLLQNHYVDGIIQTRADQSCPYKTQTIVSRTEEDVLSCMGSRYSVSSPLAELSSLMQEGKKYAFVGKPCDVSALRMYMESNTSIKNRIPYLLSFFCAGEPSDDAQRQLLDKLNVSEADCVSLRYRGDGWPGFAIAEQKDGKIGSISYNDSWGKILGRDVRKSCRLCLDGIGELADISCGDAWHLTAENEPDFSEHDGRNVVFARTDKGSGLIREMKEAGLIALEPYDIDELKYIQKYQFERRASLYAILAALRICGRPVPGYDRKVLKAFSKNMPVLKQMKRFAGTIRRVWNKRM